MESKKTKLNTSKIKGNGSEESQTFNYDANGNRLNLTENKDTAEEIQTVYSILENSNRLTKVGQIEHQYDNNGNIINDGEHTYSYDARNRLVSIDNGTTASYRNNASNMRVMKTVQ